MIKKKPPEKEERKTKKLISVSLTAGQLAIVVVTIFSVAIAGLAYLEFRLSHIENHLQSRLAHSESLTQDSITHNDILTQGRLADAEKKLNLMQEIYAELTVRYRLLLQDDEYGNSIK